MSEPNPFLRAALAKTCSVAGCGSEVRARGLCNAHYCRLLQRGTTEPYAVEIKTCSVDGCNRTAKARGWCQAHYHRWTRYGTPEGGTYRGGDDYRYEDKKGYVKIRDRNNPRADRVGMIFEHIVVMEKMIGRPLTPDETVHHKNGIRSDNRPKNLELWSGRHSKGQRVEDLQEFAVEIIKKYGWPKGSK